MTPIETGQAMQRAMNHYQSAQLHDAETICRQVVDEQPNHLEALNMLAVVSAQLGRTEDAIALLRRALELSPQFAEGHNNLAHLLHAARKYDEAIDASRRALAIAPGFAHAYYNLGLALRSKGDLNQAAAAQQQAIALKPDYAEAWNELGRSLQAGRQVEQASGMYQRAVALQPNHPEFHNDLGTALQALGRFDEAMAEYRRAIELAPDFPDPHNNLALTLQSCGRWDQVLDAHRRAIALAPDNPLLHYNLSLSLLLTGDFNTGWDEYEWRFRIPSLNLPRRNFPQPQWTGQDLHNKRILIYPEQGFGDSIQFARLAPLLKQRGATVIFECQPELIGILRTMSGIDSFITAGDPLPEFDLHCPLLSMPRALKLELNGIPGSVPYVYADPQRATMWQERLSDSSSLFKVGLAWSGSAAHRSDATRSIPALQLAPLKDVAGVRWISLQKDIRAQPLPAGMELIDWTKDLHDFADTAALIQNLDLVITADTAVAHVAGALGKAVWVMLTYVPDWRWMLDRSDSPWYPTMKLFRQAKPGDWPSVIGQVSANLRQRVGPAR